MLYVLQPFTHGSIASQKIALCTPVIPGLTRNQNNYQISWK